MQLSVEFPSVAYREGPTKVAELARAIEDIGYDDIAMFDHVVMGHPTATRAAPMYPPQMPILEALVTLGYIAAVTTRVGLSTEVLVLPQRQAVLVAKQASTIDTLSGGRLRLGVGVGWQAAEYEALDQDFSRRGRRMDDLVRLLRSCWTDDSFDVAGEHFSTDAIAMEPKPPQPGGIPIWIGGLGPAALRRAGEVGDGWMATVLGDDPGRVRADIERIREHARACGRDPSSIGMQAMLAPPPRDERGKRFYQHHDDVVRRAELLVGWGFDVIALNATAIFQAGARTVDALARELEALHTALRAALS